MEGKAEGNSELNFKSPCIEEDRNLQWTIVFL